MLETGDRAPEFELPNQHGEPVSLDREGRVVVYFYPRANTQGCTIEAHGFRDELSRFDEADVTVLGISDDPVSDLAKFAEEHDLEFDLLSDESGEVAAAYDSYGEKEMGGNTFEGVSRNTYVVTDGRVEAAYEGVSPEGHAEEVLAGIEEAEGSA